MKRTHFEIPGWEADDTIEIGVKQVVCTAEGWNGNAMRGYLLDFDPEHRQLKIQAMGESRVLGLKFNQLKRLKIDTDPEQDEPDFQPTDFVRALSADEPHPFVVHLRDGAMFSGIAYSHRKMPYGLWLFPRKALDGDPARVFIPKSGITRFEQRSAGDVVISDTDFNETVMADVESFGVEAVLGSGPSLVETPQQLLEALDNQARLKPVPIGEALLGLGKITSDQLTQALLLQKANKALPLGQMLVEMGLVTPTDLQTAFARKMGYPFVEVTKFPVDVSALRKVPQPLAVRLQVLPLMEFRSSIVVGMADPLQFKVIEELEFTTQRKVVPVVVTSADLTARIVKVYREIGMGDLQRVTSLDLSPKTPEVSTLPPDGLDAFQLAVELSGELKEPQEDERQIEQSDNTLVKLINSMITEAFYQRASDIHIEPYPGREKLVIRFRVDGEMRPYLELPATYRNAMIARIKIMCDLDIAERRKPQDGKINFARFGGLPIELRVATIPTSNGIEDVVMRILSSSKPIPLEAMGLSAQNFLAFERIMARPYGLFLCVGPTGSGKTTTLHSALQRINVPQRKIWTAEDPVEITQRGLRQIQVNHKIGWTFANALRTLLRADPDVIMVGEVRDSETADICIEASLTGHLVLSTLHTNSAAETIVRLIDLGVDPFSFADSLQGILAQRLVKRLCTDCAEMLPMDEEQLDDLVDDYQFVLPPEHPLRDRNALVSKWQSLFAKDGKLLMGHPRGCEKCGNTGFRGRVALHEMLVTSSEIRQLVQSRARPQQILSTAIGEGMLTLRQDGIEKVLSGLTNMTEVHASSNW